MLLVYKHANYTSLATRAVAEQCELGPDQAHIMTSWSNTCQQCKQVDIQVAHGLLDQIHAVIDDPQPQQRRTLEDLVLLYGITAQSDGAELTGVCVCMHMSSIKSLPSSCNTVVSLTDKHTSLSASKQPVTFTCMATYADLLS